MSIIREARESLLWTFLQQSGTQLIGFILQVILARILDPADYGLIAMIVIFISIGQTLMDGGLTSSLIRTNNISDDDYSTVFTINIFFSLLFYILIFFIAPFIAIFYEQPILTSILRVYSLSFVINALYAVHIAKFAKELDFKTQLKFQLPAIFLGACIGISFALLGYGVWSLVALNLSQSILTGLSFWVGLSWKPKFHFDKDIFKKHFHFGYKMTLSGLINTIYDNLYKIIIGKNYSPVNVGFFSKADEMRLLPVKQIMIILSKVTYPVFVKINEEKENALKKAYQMTMHFILAIMAPVMIILIIVAEPLFYILFGEKWLPSVPYFQILCIASIVSPISLYNLNILKVKGRSDLFLKLEIIKKIIGISALAFAIRYDIIGIVWALCLTNFFFTYLNGFFSGKLINYHLPEQLKDSFKMIVLAVIPGIGSYCIYTLYLIYTFSPLASILSVALLYGLVYLAIIYVFDKRLIKEIQLILHEQ